MRLSPDYMCPNCGKKVAGIFWLKRKRLYLCDECMRLLDPPYMTLMGFKQGSVKKLWNLEVGQYEEFEDVDEIAWCGWMVRSVQETLYHLVPRTTAYIYHLEFFSDHKCGRCVDYKHFDPDAVDCLAKICKGFDKPFRPEKEIQYPPQRSRYTKWMKMRP